MSAQLTSIRNYPRNYYDAKYWFGNKAESILLNVHLYFLKLFGCYINDAGSTLRLNSFAENIINGTPNDNVFLRFERKKYYGYCGRTDLHEAVLSDGSVAFATWLYEAQTFAVNILFAIEDENRDVLLEAWHPRLGTKIIFAEFD